MAFGKLPQAQGDFDCQKAPGQKWLGYKSLQSHKFQCLLFPTAEPSTDSHPHGHHAEPDSGSVQVHHRRVDRPSEA